MLAAVAGQILPTAPAGVVSLLAMDEAPLPGYPAGAAGLAGTQVLVQALGDAGVNAPLWVLTRGAVATGAGEVLASPMQAMAWGLGRVAGLEHPDRWGGLVDAAAGAGRAGGGPAVRACWPGCGEDQVAIRAAGMLARRLVRAPLPGAAASAGCRAGRCWSPAGPGAWAGGWPGGWPARGAPRVVLASRSGPDAAGVAVLAAALAGAGTAIVVAACDVTARAQVAGLLARIAAGGPRLAAVVHTAGAGLTAAMAETAGGGAGRGRWRQGGGRRAPG